MKAKMKKYLAALLALAMVFTTIPTTAAKAEGTTDDGLLASWVFNDDGTITDESGNGYEATLKGVGGTVANGILNLPGGGHQATSNANSPAYVELPGDMFEGQDTLTISVWLKNQTGSGNYCAMFFGTPTGNAGGGSGSNPVNYWLLNPANPDGNFKSVWTNGDNSSSPWSTETATSSTKTGSGWALYTTVITPDRIVGYLDGVEVTGGNNAKNKTTTDFGTNLCAYIGRSGYPDMFYKGGVYGVKVYNKALTQEEIISKCYSDIPYDLVDTAIADIEASFGLNDGMDVIDNLILPTSGAYGATVAWSSNNPAVIAEDGTVTRDMSQDVAVTLTATITLGGRSVEKTYSVNVVCGSKENIFNEAVEAFALDFSYVDADTELPATVGENTAITWASNDAAIVVEGTTAKVSRPAEGQADKVVELTATIVYNDGTNSFTKEKKFTVTVRALTYGYLMAYTNPTDSNSSVNREDLGASLHLAYSKDGRDFTALNSNTGICFANNAGGKKNVNPNGLRNVYIFRKTDGTYGLLATNVDNNQKYMYVFDSENLVAFTNERKLNVSTNVAGDFKVENTEEGYKVYWTDGSKQYSLVTADFKKIISQGEDSYESEDRIVDGTVPTGAIVGNILSVGKTEYDYVVNKIGIVKNTGIKEVAVNATLGSSTDKLLPAKVTAEYSDGSTTDMNVVWNAADLAAVDMNKEGVYTVTGTIQQTQYANPLIEQRADPCILKADDGYYYFTASYPMLGGGDNNGYDKVVLRRSETIEGLADAEEITIWDCDNEPTQHRYIWAPEIHQVNGDFYVFYTASAESNNVWGIRPHVLKCTDKDNIMDPDSWETVGRMIANSGDGQAFNGFSLDMTIFEVNGHWYVAWAQSVGFSSILLAEVDPNEPWKCISDSVIISKPEYSWERQYENVNEGPSIIKNNGMLYMAFSVSATGPEYCIGLLSIPEDGDLLNPSEWWKQPYPVLTSADVPGEYGPGHNSFTFDEDGNSIFVYHARDKECVDNQCGSWASGDPLYDPCRDARLKRVHWAVDGSPILKMSYEEELAPEFKTVTATVKVAASAGSNVNTPVVSETKVELDLDKATVGVKEKITLKATVSGAEGQVVAWTSDDTKVATVDANGKVTAKKTGKATITATVNGKSATCVITVKKAPKKISVKKKNVTLKKGKTAQIKVKLPKNTASYKFTYKSSKKKIATVSATGLITAKKKGKAVITVKAFNGKSAKVTVKVK